MKNNQDMGQYLDHRALLKHFASDPIFINAQIVFAELKQSESVRYNKSFKGGKK